MNNKYFAFYSMSLPSFEDYSIRSRIKINVNGFFIPTKARFNLQCDLVLNYSFLLSVFKTVVLLNIFVENVKHFFKMF